MHIYFFCYRRTAYHNAIYYCAVNRKPPIERAPRFSASYVYMFLKKVNRVVLIRQLIYDLSVLVYNC